MMTPDQTAYKETAGVATASGKVLPEWIDVNGHMNAAYYVLAFDQGLHALWDRLHITPEYVKTSNCSTFAAECHITYQMELREDAPFLITSQILAYDEKRIHPFQCIYHADKHYLAATAEWLALHVDLTSRRVTPWPQSILSALQKFTERQGVLPKPPEAGQKIRLHNPVFVGVDR